MFQRYTEATLIRQSRFGLRSHFRPRLAQGGFSTPGGCSSSGAAEPKSKNGLKVFQRKRRDNNAAPEHERTPLPLTSLLLALYRIPLSVIRRNHHQPVTSVG
jgi:hypothetical protein